MKRKTTTTRKASAKKSSIKFDQLSPEIQNAVARKLGGAALGLARRAHFSKGFEVVSFPFNHQRRGAFVETQGEDKQLTQYQRHQIVNLHRDMLRNSPTRVAQDQQIRVNVVGSVGGKLYASFPPEAQDAAQAVMDYFNKKWFPHAEFTFGKDFNWLLKTVLTAEDTTGNVILVFDDGILTGGNGTGRIRGFEGDEIAPVADTEFFKHFQKSFTQRMGLVYNESGMNAGAFVSTKCRGRGMFVEGEYLPLKVDPFESFDTNWVVLGSMRRFNQGRAVSPLTAAINCLIDLHEITASETQAAKVNAQLVGQILSDATAPDPNSTTPAGFSDETPEAEALPDTVEFDIRELKSIGAHFDQMPEGMKMELMDTRRPNANMPAYIDFLAGLAGGARGLARVYSTLKAETSYTAFRGEQLMTRPSFEEAQIELEREVCDWAARCVIRRAVKLGLINAALPDGWENMIAWRWPKMQEIDETKAQQAVALQLQNGTTSLTRLMGPGEVPKVIEERTREKALFNAAGLAYPGEAAPAPAPVTEPEAENENETEQGGDNA